MTIDVAVLGPLEVTGSDGPVVITGPKERAVLATLAVWVGDAVSVERLTDALWGEQPPRSAVHVLHNLVSSLRKALGADTIETRPGGYALQVPPDAIDTRRFEQLVREGGRLAAGGDWTAAAGALSSAIALWRGAPFGELTGWAPSRGEAVRLEELCHHAHEELATAELARGHHTDVVAPLEMLVSDQPLREQRWALLMRALYLCGRQADALRAYQRARGALEEVGLEPGPELQRLERHISVRDPSLGEVGAPRQPSVAPRPAEPLRHNLGGSLNRFVGRSVELEEIGGLLDRARLVTLVGVGGAGKTRLACEAARAAVNRFPHGAWMVELAALQEETAVASALAEALGISVSECTTAAAVEEVVCAQLKSRRTLLLLDNCEHLLGTVARIVHLLLRTCPGVTVLATSRERLGLPGEVTMDVPPLSLPERADLADAASADAVALFTERAQEARPQFELTEANAPAVARVCRMLDGIPLAIELAAAWTRMLSVDQIAERAVDGLELLTGGSRTADARHRTLRAALDWSHDLLGPAEQAALRRLAVFPHRFDLAAAAAVVEGAGPLAPNDEPGPSGVALVARLVDSSLVVVDRRDEDVRYRLLEPVRQYAALQLEAAGETEALRDLHRDIFLSRAVAALRYLGGLTHGHRELPDLPNYRAALAWSWQQGDMEAALELVWIQIVHWLWIGDAQGREWVERIVAASEHVEHRARAFTLLGLATLLRDSADPDPARQEVLLGEAAALAHRLDDAETLAGISFGLGEHALALGNTEEARALTEAALVAYEGLDARASVGWCHDHLGWVALAERDHERARAHFEQAAEIAQVCDDEWLDAHALAALAPLTVLVGQTDRGLRLAEASIVAARRVGVPGVLVMVLSRAAETAMLAGDQWRAGEILVELLQSLHGRGSRRWLADALEVAALVLEARGDEVGAVEVLAVCAVLREAAGELPGGGRAIAREVHACSERLVSTLGTQHVAACEARGRKVPPDDAIVDVVARLQPESTDRAVNIVQPSPRR